jgi:hypothetical protein
VKQYRFADVGVADEKDGAGNGGIHGGAGIQVVAVGRVCSRLTATLRRIAPGLDDLQQVFAIAKR